ncbi:MAG: hypothetical protein VYA80_02370 [Pseudomonadota bacterium]|nr:hypothetical protein [Pseudomonadota bacterium]
MSVTNYFSQASFNGPSWLNWAMLALIFFSLGVGIVFFNERAKHDPNVHSPILAWIRAWVYYCIVILLSWVTGALGLVLSQPLIQEGRTNDSSWLILISICWLITIWGYAYWWPKGTLTHGRKLYIIPALVHGIFWGLCAGLLYLSMYAIIEQFDLPAVVNAIILILILSVYNTNYQVGWWDIYVSPPHNIRSTNIGKVLFVHQPFMISSLSLLVIYGDMVMYVLLTTFAMSCSSIAMRFPAFWEKDGVRVSRGTAMGE